MDHHQQSVGVGWQSSCGNFRPIFSVKSQEDIMLCVNTFAWPLFKQPGIGIIDNPAPQDRFQAVEMKEEPEVQLHGSDQQCAACAVQGGSAIESGTGQV